MPTYRSQSPGHDAGYAGRGGIPADDDAEDSLLSYWKRLSAHKGLVIGFTLLGVLAGVLFAIPQTPLYRSRVSLEIQVLNEDFLNRKSVEATAANYAADTYMQTQIKILQSSSLVERVTQKLRSQGLPEEPAPAGLLPYVQRVLRLPAYEAQMFADKSLDMAGDSVNVRGSGMTRVVEVFCESPRPKLTAEFANLLAEEFIRSGVEVRLELSRQTSNTLARQVQEAKVRLENAEHVLQDKARALGLEFTFSDGANLADGKLQQLQLEILRAQADKVQKQSRYELTQSRDLESLAEILDDPSVREYRTRLADLQRQSAELSATVTSAHPKMLRLQPQIEVLRTDIEGQRRHILDRIKKDYEAALRREDLLKREYVKQSKLVSEKALNAIEYNIARREADTNRQVYAAMMQRVKEAEVAAVTQAGNARIIDRAKPARAPSKPNIPLNAAIGGFGGSFIGILFVLSQDRLRRNFVTRNDLVFMLHMPELGVIPPATPSKVFRLPKLLEAGALAQRTIDKSPDGVALANSFHFTLTSILFSGSSRNPRKLLVLTSPGYGEGKTFTAVNLAVASSRMRQRVLLVDADFRKPELHRTFNLANDRGFSDLLLSTERLNEQTKQNFLQPTSMPGLTVLTSGSSTDGTSFMFSSRLIELMAWFREHFDTVFIDAPAILHASEARLLALHADAAILVVRSGCTTRELAQAAVLRLSEDRIPVLGTIMNDCNHKDELRASKVFDI